MKQQLPFPFVSPGRGLRVVSAHTQQHYEKCNGKTTATKVHMQLTNLQQILFMNTTDDSTPCELEDWHTLN